MIDLCFIVYLDCFLLRFCFHSPFFSTSLSWGKGFIPQRFVFNNVFQYCILIFFPFYSLLILPENTGNGWPVYNYNL